MNAIPEFSGYEVLREIGRGGMAVVYLARQRSLGRQVAIKLLVRSAPLHSEAATRFLTEARTLADLTHPGIVTIHDVVHSESADFIVMEYLAAGSLDQRLRARLRFDQALGILAKIGGALDHAHANGVVHRDVKPENVLFRDPDTPVLTDFGIARVLHSESGRITEQGVVLGTPLYMSPEQIQGDHVDGRADMYGLGVMFYQMLAGHPPFQAESPQELLSAHLARAPLPLPEPYTSLQPVLDGMLAKSPASRYARMADMVDDLRERLLATPLLMRELDAIPGTTTTDRLQALGFPGTERFAQSTQRITPAATTQRDPRSRFKRLVAVSVAMVLAGVFVVSAWWAWRALDAQQSSAAGQPAPAALTLRLAVLPLANLSPDPANAFFADGLHDELLTALSRLGGLRVISRTSMLTYRDTAKSARQIATELDASHVLSGAVRREGDAVRLSVQLVDPKTEDVLWAESYDRSLQQALNLQSEVATDLAQKLRYRIMPEELAALKEGGTRNAEARDLYLQIRQSDEGPDDPRFEQALALDPNFVAARAGRAYQHLLAYWLNVDPTPARLAKARSDIDLLQKIAPQSDDTAYVLSNYDYYARRDYAAAAARIEPLVALRPHQSELQRLLALLYRRMGRMEDASHRFELSIEGDPLNFAADWNFTEHLLGAREYARAFGRIERMRDRDLIQNSQSQTLINWWIFNVSGEQAGPLGGRSLAPGTPGEFTVAFDISQAQANNEALVLKLENAETPIALFADEHSPSPPAFLKLYAAWLREDPELAAQRLPAALAALEAGMDSAPNRGFRLFCIALAHAFAAQREQALRFGERALAAVPVEHDALDGAFNLGGVAMALAVAGEHSRALDLIERSLGLPYGLRESEVRDSVLLGHALAGNPRYQRLVVTMQERLDQRKREFSVQLDAARAMLTAQP